MTHYFLNRSNVKRRLEFVQKNDRLKDSANRVIVQMDEMLKIGQGQPTLLESGARDFAISLANLFVASLFLQNAILPNTYSNAELLALRWVTQLLLGIGPSSIPKLGRSPVSHFLIKILQRARLDAIPNQP